MTHLSLRLGSRRRFLQGLTASLAGLGMSPWLPSLAEAARGQAKRRHCILLWMTGGPSQTDTFDMKPGHANGGQFRETATTVPGLRFSEHLPRLAQQAEHLAVLRGLSTAEGDHGRGTYLMRTGRRPEGVVRFPTLGSFLSKSLAADDDDLPSYVSVNPYVEFEPTAFEPGFLGPRHAPLNVRPRDFPDAEGFAQMGVDHLRPPGGWSLPSVGRRVRRLQELQADLVGPAAAGPAHAHHTTLERAIRLMSGEAGRIFDLSDEPAELRARYGPGNFGQGCLLARRLIERGVSFVEVSLGDAGRWDTHGDNFNVVQQLSEELDAGWATLLEDLQARGLLESTTIIWMGEFGRTPQINSSAGRDHFPNAWSAVLAGGGIRGGQAYGRTSADGMSVEEGQIGVGDLLATLCVALGLDPKTQNVSDIQRPFKLAEGQPIAQVLAEPPAPSPNT